MCVTSLLCGPRADLWPFYGFLCKRFSLYIKVYQGWALQRGVVSKTKHSKTKTEARSTLDRKRSTQNSKTKYPRSKTKTPKYRKRGTQISKTKTPKSRKRNTLDRKRSTQKLDTGLSFISARPMLIQHESSTITNAVQIYSSCKCISAAALEARWEAMFWT